MIFTVRECIWIYTILQVTALHRLGLAEYLLAQQLVPEDRVTRTFELIIKDPMDQLVTDGEVRQPCIGWIPALHWNPFLLGPPSGVYIQLDLFINPSIGFGRGGKTLCWTRWSPGCARCAGNVTSCNCHAATLSEAPHQLPDFHPLKICSHNQYAPGNGK